MTQIDTEKEYLAIMARIEELLSIVNEDTPEDNIYSIELTLLSNLAADYEDVHYPIEVPSLVDLLKLRMYEMGLTQNALAEIIGISASRLSEILSGKREPTIKTARAICIHLNIDASVALGIA